MKLNKQLNKELPKYKKVFEKEYSLESLGTTENGSYIVFDRNISDVNPIYQSRRGLEVIGQRNFIIKQTPVFFFELFKYLRKYEDKCASTQVTSNHELLKLIKSHLVQKFCKRMSENRTPYNAISNIRILNKYGELVDECFKIFKPGTKVTLVIQKRIGYKYYQQTIYK